MESGHCLWCPLSNNKKGDPPQRARPGPHPARGGVPVCASVLACLWVWKAVRGQHGQQEPISMETRSILLVFLLLSDS